MGKLNYKINVTRVDYAFVIFEEPIICTITVMINCPDVKHINCVLLRVDIINMRTRTTEKGVYV